MGARKHGMHTTPGDAARGGERRRRRGLEAIAGTLPKVAARALGRRGFGGAGLIADWRNIVGAEIAQRCAPLRLAFPQPRQRREGTLLLRVEPGFALELQHLAPLLVARVNTYFGYQAVAQLRIQQGPLAHRTAAAPTRPVAALAAEDPLNDDLAGIEDDELRASLRRLAESYRARQRRRGGGNRS